MERLNRILHARAFTLVEVLVVMIISAILAAVTFLAMRDTGPEDLLAEDLHRLAALLKHNCREALVYGQHLGIRVSASGYDVFRFEGTGWISTRGESAVYRHRDWSNNWQLQLTFEGFDAPIEDSDETPQLICLGSGELLPFTISLSDGPATSLVLLGHADGQMSIVSDP